MRPRLIASENAPEYLAAKLFFGRFNEAEADRLGKRRDTQRCSRRIHVASMRPRLIASENYALRRVVEDFYPASMRPRLIASENRHQQ